MFRKHRGFFTWKLGEKVKIAYKERFLKDYDIQFLTFNHAFGLATLLLTAGFVILVAAGGTYWNATDKTWCYLIPVSIILPLMVVNIWSTHFFNTLD